MGDEIATILERTLHIIEAFLGSRIHIEHLPRKKTWEACLVDNLSREETTSRWDRDLLKSFPCRDIPKVLSAWMKNPEADWSLPTSLLNHVKTVVGNGMK